MTKGTNRYFLWIPSGTERFLTEHDLACVEELGLTVISNLSDSDCIIRTIALIPSGMALSSSAHNFLAAVIRVGESFLAGSLESSDRTDDFLRTPCDCNELAFRLNKHLTSLKNQELKTWQDQLNTQEDMLYKLFLQNRGITIERFVISQMLEGHPGGRAVDMSISRLRKRLCEAGTQEKISTIRGMGYRLE